MVSVQYADTKSVLKNETSLQNVPMGILQIIYAQRVKASFVMGTLSYVHSQPRLFFLPAHSCGVVCGVWCVVCGVWCCAVLRLCYPCMIVRACVHRLATTWCQLGTKFAKVTDIPTLWRYATKQQKKIEKLAASVLLLQDRLEATNRQPPVTLEMTEAAVVRGTC